ncbi:hypothetical protein Tco_1163450 [Tanacetum coccineum]
MRIVNKIDPLDNRSSARFEVEENDDVYSSQMLVRDYVLIRVPFDKNDVVSASKYSQSPGAHLFRPGMCRLSGDMISELWKQKRMRKKRLLVEKLVKRDCRDQCDNHDRKKNTVEKGCASSELEDKNVLTSIQALHQDYKVKQFKSRRVSEALIALALRDRGLEKRVRVVVRLCSDRVIPQILYSSIMQQAMQKCLAEQNRNGDELDSSSSVRYSARMEVVVKEWKLDKLGIPKNLISSRH